MKAIAGDRIIIRGTTVESTDRHGLILEVKGADGAPPYHVRFDDGHETIIFPGGDFVVERHGVQQNGAEQNGAERKEGGP